MRNLTTLIMLCFIFLSSAASGQNPIAPNIVAPVASEKSTASGNINSGVHELSAADAEAFLDGILLQQLAQDDIAGATVVVVKDGKILFSKGYGYADVANKKPVIANETMFRPGSISKLFTWTAVMQLVEQGKLDLDRDINEYLDFKIPDAFGKPITLKNIMTHTAGFEEQIKDLISYSTESPNLGEYVKMHVPARIYAPGTVPAYSNYATALAGYIVERVSGQPYSQYIEENIFRPLKMNHSTFVQPLPPAFAPYVSKGYATASEEAKSFETVAPFPAGSLSSTAEDMAQFMLAHLQNGQLGDGRILKPETVKLMHSNLFNLDTAANSMAHGFYEENSHGLRIIGHAGDTNFFHSDLHLIEERGVGFFISYNSAGRNQTGGRIAIWHAFLDRYYPQSLNEPALESAKQDAQAVAGNYMNSRMSETTMFKALSLLGLAKVIPDEDGTIQVSQLLNQNGKPKKWREVAPLTFREVDGQDTLVFKPDADGRMQIVLPYPFMIMRRVGLWENGSVLLPVLGISLGIMLLTLVLWFVAWLVRKHYGEKLELTPTDWWLRILVRVVFALSVIFPIALIGFLTYATSHLELLSDKGNPVIWFIQIIGVLAALGSLIVFYNAIRVCLNRQFGIWKKVQATIFALACLGFLWFVLTAHLLNFNSNY